MLRDRNGGLWIRTAERGLLHLHEGRADWYSQADGLSSNRAVRVYEDREGSIWVATTSGLDRFCDYAVAAFSEKQGLSNGTVESVLADRDGSVWLGTLDGLNRWNRGKVTIYRNRARGLQSPAVLSLFQDERGRILLPESGVWPGLRMAIFGRCPVCRICRGRISPATMRGHNGSPIPRPFFAYPSGVSSNGFPGQNSGRKDWAPALQPDRGGLWVGFYEGGLAYWKDGQVRASYVARDGLGEGRVETLRLDGASALWVATAGGLSRILKRPYRHARRQERIALRQGSLVAGRR